MAPVTTSGRRAAVLAVGSELLDLGRTDTNSPYISAQLHRVGFQVAFTTVVSDEWHDLVETLRHALRTVDLVVCTGGLGPTDDDRTRDAAAAVLGLSLHEDPGVVAQIEARFRARQLAMPAINRRQAHVPDGATVVPNPRGTAPGLWIPADGKAVVLLPGPPREMEPMIAHVIEEHVLPTWGGGAHLHRTVIVAGRSESWVDEQVQPIYGPWRREPLPILTTVLASLGTVELHLSVQGAQADVMAARLAAATAQIAAHLGDDVVSTDGRGLTEVLGDALRARGWRLGIAESCTGGLIASRLTDVPGSSDYVDRGVVCYSNASKTALLGVPAPLIEGHGAVSEPVALAMADGLRRLHGVDVAVATTGVAGPGGGTPAKPVGMVCMAIAGPGGARSRTSQFPGDRLMVKTLAANTALDWLRRYVHAVPR